MTTDHPGRERHHMTADQQAAVLRQQATDQHGTGRTLNAAANALDDAANTIAALADDLDEARADADAKTQRVGELAALVAATDGHTLDAATVATWLRSEADRTDEAELGERRRMADAVALAHNAWHDAAQRSDVDSPLRRADEYLDQALGVLRQPPTGPGPTDAGYTGKALRWTANLIDPPANAPDQEPTDR